MIGYSAAAYLHTKELKVSVLEYRLPIHSDYLYDQFYGMGFYCGRSFAWSHREKCTQGNCGCLPHVQDKVTELPTLEDEREFMRTIGFLAGWAYGRDASRPWPNLNYDTATV